MYTHASASSYRHNPNSCIFTGKLENHSICDRDATRDSGAKHDERYTVVVGSILVM